MASYIPAKMALFAAWLLNFKNIADAEDVALGLSGGVTVRSAVPTPVPAPVDAPTLAITGAIPGQVTIGVRVPGATGKAKPDGCIGCEVWAVAGVAPAVDPAQTAFRNIATKSPFNFSVPEGDKGKDITVFARYTTRSGPGGIAQQGPWSLPLHFVGM